MKHCCMVSSESPSVGVKTLLESQRCFGAGGSCAGGAAPPCPWNTSNISRCMCLFRQTLIKSPSLLFTWVLLLEPEQKQPPMHTGSSSSSVGPGGRCPCIHVRARDGDCSHRQGWRAAANTLIHPLLAAERWLQKWYKGRGKDLSFLSGFLSPSRTHDSPAPSHSWNWMHLMKPHQSAPRSLLLLNVNLGLSRSMLRHSRYHLFAIVKTLS